MCPSATLAMSEKSSELRSQGIDVINLSVGEPDFSTPPCIKEAAIEAINSNQTHYTPVAGIPELRKAIADKLKREDGLYCEPENIVVSNGAKHSLANIMMTILEEGDEVLIPSPYWVSYPELAKLSDGTPKFIHCDIESDFKMTPEQLENSITEKSKLLIFNSPSNPTGMLYSRDELAALAEVIARHPNLYVVSDEIYEYLVYEGEHQSLGAFKSIYDRVIIVNGVSKGYAMTGWRIGYIAAPVEIAKACTKLQGQYTSGPNSIAQWASLKAIGDPDCSREDLKEMHTAFKSRRDYMMGRLENMEGVEARLPNGAFYIFPNIKHFFGKSFEGKTISNDKDLAMYLLNQAHIAIVPGSAFGNEDCIRISYAARMEKLKIAMDQMEVALRKLI
jgi:aspartate aminotransferase